MLIRSQWLKAVFRSCLWSRTLFSLSEAKERKLPMEVPSPLLFLPLLTLSGEMAILLYGQCVTRSALGTNTPPSFHSLHQLSTSERKVAEGTRHFSGHSMRSLRQPWPQKGDRLDQLIAHHPLDLSIHSSAILPSHLQRSDKLISLGSVIGGELCIRDDLEALQSVFVSPLSLLLASLD
jgi:hypothetical protein